MVDLQCYIAFKRFNVILTYLNGHNNPINRFRPVATHPSRCLRFLRVYASWSHQTMTGLPRFGPSNGSSSSPTSVDPRIKYPSRRSILLHTNDITGQCSRWILIRCTTSMSLSMRKSSPTRTGYRRSYVGLFSQACYIGA